jgi:hypothetical protein
MFNLEVTINEKRLEPTQYNNTQIISRIKYNPKLCHYLREKKAMIDVAYLVEPR